MNEFKHQIQILQQRYPKLKITDVQLNEDGQYNLVLIINETFIFRFPKYESGIEQLALEAKILKAIQPHLSLAVPDPIFQNFETAVVGEAFMGYKMIPGQPLWLSDFRAIPGAAGKLNLATQLALFLRELHAIPIETLVDEAVPVCDTRQEWLDIYGRVQSKLFPYMRLDACKSVAQHFETTLSGPEFEYEPCLRHGDFGTGNILYLSDTQTINGVIDFGFTTLGDPAIDFAGLLSFGEPFVRHMEKTVPELVTYWPRIWFYKGTFALLEALFGIENGDHKAFERGIADYI